MEIELIESEEIFSKEDIKELEGFLSKLPSSHLQCLNRIERVASLEGALADSSPWGNGEEIRLPNDFYRLNPKERICVFLHEMGHHYFDFKDEYEGSISCLKWGACEKKDVSHLLRVKWMDLGLWELEPKNWEKVKALFPGNGANRDKYTYIVKYKNPNYEMGEWKCPIEARIPKNSFHEFRYCGRGYSPKEEMADAYALFVLEKEHFKKSAERNKIIKDKYEFIKRHFSDDSKVEFTKKYNLKSKFIS